MNMEVNALQQMLSRMRQVQEDLQRQVNSVAVEAFGRRRHGDREDERPEASAGS